MAKEPEDFSKIEDKFKLSLMQTDKRIVDLEVAVSELSSKITETKSADELKQRVDDLEDLTMIETMGVTELKKMMEQIRDSVKPPEAPDLSAIEQKIADLENQIGTLPKPEQVDLSGIQSDTKSLNESLNSLKESYTGIQSQIDMIINEINTFRKEILTEIQNLKTSRPEVAIQFLTSRLESFRAANDELQNGLDAVSIKLQNLESMFSDFQKSPTLPDETNRRIENIQKDWLEINSRIDSLEAVIKGFYKTHDELQLELKKFDTFEKASTLKEDLEKKMEEFKFVESEIKRLSGRIEMVYENIDKRLDKVKELEKKVPEILESVENLSKEIDKNKIEIIDRVRSDELKEVKKFVEAGSSEVAQMIKENNSKLTKEIESTKKLTEGKFAELELLDVVKKSELDKIRQFFEENNKKIVKDLENLRKPVENKISDLTKEIENIQKSQKDLPNIKQLVNQTEDIQNKFRIVENINQTLHKEMSDLRLLIGTQDARKTTDRISQLEKEIENKMRALNMKIESFKTPESPLEEELKEIVERMILLETRLVAIEKLIQESASIQPIILE